MRRKIRLITVFLVIFMVLPGIAEASLDKGQIKRLSGPNRITTAINVSKEAYKEGAKTIILAGYSGSADALTGTLLASDNNSPLLIVPNKGKLSDELRNEIKRLGANNIYILGGPNAVPKSIESELKNMKLNVERVYGANRFETAVAIANKATDKTELFLALGIKILPNGKEDALADALAIGPVSAKEDKPVLLTRKDKLPQSTKNAINKFGVNKVTIVGGTAAISEKVTRELKNMGISVSREEGANRYDTAAKIAKKYFSDSKNTMIASGVTDTDALVGGYLGALYNSPMLLTNTNSLPSSTKKYVKDFSEASYILGGESVVSKSVFNNIRSIYKGEIVDDNDGNITIDQVPYKINILEPNSIGTVWMEATYKNNTKYPITSFSMTVLLKDTNETTYLSNHDTVMPGETSPKFDTFGPSTMKKEDFEILTIDMRAELPNNKYLRIDYDTKLKKYEYNEYEHSDSDNGRGITVDKVPYNINILEPNSIGTVWMEATYKNNTKYPITSFSMTVLLKDTNKTTYLSNHDTVMPGETSPKFDTFGPSTMKKEDFEILTIDMRAELPSNKYLRIDYDNKLKKYEYNEYNN